MNKSFCVFIISHGRPDKIVTLTTLKKANYTGPLFIVCDNEDKNIGKYIENYGSSMVLTFDKMAYAQKVDSCDNFQNRRTTTHARNACFDLAQQLGFEYFLVLDDDYTSFKYNYTISENQLSIKKINNIFEAFCLLLESDSRLYSICFMQGGDIIGGKNCTSFKRMEYPFKKRKAMNSFFCKTSRRFWFFSRLNEDVNTYLSLGSRGKIFMTIPDITLNQAQTQSTSGGMSDAYLASGTYVKSFYSVMINPSFAKVSLPKEKSCSIKRIHHKISWNNAVPKIIDETNKKP